MFRIYLVEDDPAIAGVLEKQLAAWDYSVETAKDFRNIFGEFQAFQPHLVLLDLSLPYRNGFHWCTQIRTVSHVPILFLSSAADNLNMIMAIHVGGDDFICKPFDLNVLLAKIQAILRRTYHFDTAAPVYQHAGATLDPASAVLHTHDQRVELTKNECRILQTLLEQTGRIVSREALMERLWATDSYIDENTLTVNIARLRRKLEQAGLPGWIKTKKGQGYLVESEPMS